ncbi:MAG TPA: ABC transporter permease, partial [Bryobacteraceae bacterium]
MITLRKLLWLLNRRKREAELRAELEFHMEEEAGDSSSARRELGNPTLLAEDTRAVWEWRLLEQFLQDLRYAFRTMAANKSFSALAILSLGLGIGANTAIYSFMDSILMRALPVQNPESLVVMNWQSNPPHGLFSSSTVLHALSGSIYSNKPGIIAGIFPYGAFELFQKNDSVLSTVFAFRPTREINITINGAADLSTGEFVSGDYFRALNVPPAAGRLILSDDDRAGAQPVAVLSYAYSQKRFGGTSAAPGQSILINNLPFTVVGVAPPEFFGVDPSTSPDIYIPLHTNMLGTVHPFGMKPSEYHDQNSYWLEIMARLRPGVTLAQAQAALAPPFHQWAASTASTDQERANLPVLTIRNGAEGLDSLRRQFSKPLYVLMTMVGLILAIACANVANPLLARSASRSREMALRLSVGAGRARVIRQLLTESVLLAALGGIAGILFAIWGIRFLTILLANGEANFTLHADLNWHVLTVAAALSLLTGILFGIAPALRSTRVDLISALKEVRASQPAAHHKHWRISLNHLLVVSQIAVSLLMLVGAGLFVRTLQNLQSIDIGFNREHVLLFQLDARQAGHQDPELCTFYGELRNKF